MDPLPFRLPPATRAAKVTPDVLAKIVRLRSEEHLEHAAIGARLGLSPSTVQRICKAHGLSAPRTKTLRKGSWIRGRVTQPSECADCRRTIAVGELAWRAESGAAVFRRVCEGCFGKRQAVRG